MTDSPSLTDDEALWFPVHMSTGDSFSRPTSADGAPLDDDGIGLPRPRGPGGGKGPKGPRPPKKGIRASSWLWLSLWGVAALGIVGYAARKEIAAEVIQGWLKGQGVQAARLKLDALNLNHASGALFIGNATTPEFSIGRFDIDYSLQPFVGGGQPLARVRRIHLMHPLVQFSVKDGRLNFGSLDKLVQSALTAPPSNSVPPDSIVIEDATVRVTTDYGLLRGQGNLSLQNGVLTFARVLMPATHLSGPLGEGDLTYGLVTARSIAAPGDGDQLHLQARFDADSWEMNGAADAIDAAVMPGQATHLQGISVELDSRLPYRHAADPAIAFSGPMDSNVAVRIKGAQTPSADIGGLEGNLHLKGALKSSGRGTAFDGVGRLLARAETLMSGNIDSRDLMVSGDTLAVKAGITLGEPTTVQIDGPVTGRVGVLRQDDLFAKDSNIALNHVSVKLDAAGFDSGFVGGVTVGRLAQNDIALENLHLSLKGLAHSDTSAGTWGAEVDSDVSSDRGSYTGLKAVADGQVTAMAEAAKKPPVPGAPIPPPADSVVVLDRALQRFSLRAKGVHLSLSGTSEAGAPAQFDLRLKNGAQLGLTGGGKAVVTTSSARPFLSSRQAGRFGLTLSGADLPAAVIAVDNLGFSREGLLGGDYKAAADFNFYPVAGGHFEGRGHFAATVDGGYNISLAEPAKFTAATAELGDHVTDLSLNLVQAGKPFLTLDSKGAFRVTGAFTDLSLKAPNESVALGAGKGTLEAFTLTDAVGLKADLTTAAVTDALTGDQMRFNPLSLSGSINNDAHALTGRFVAATASAHDAKGQPLGIVAIDLDNDNVTGKGALGFHTLDLTFDAAGLQPVYLSPLVAAIFSKDVSGKAGFTGAFTWDKQGSGSSGVLTLDGLNYVGATGATHGLNGHILFTSLAPLASDPGQMISIDSMQVGVPLSDLRLSLQFLGDTIAIESALVQTPGGPVILEPTVLPLDGKSAISGAVKFDGLDFGKIIAATDLSTSMSFEGNLSGRLPFKIDGGHLSFADGLMASDAPGRISIKRTAVSGVAATGTLSSPDTKAPAAVDPNFNPFQDLAFQAMEYVRFDKIDARLNSIPGGKLNINFHIKGYFDPPQKQEARISLFDYISGKWMQKPIKLPSKTPVELYLEVPVNLDEILNDLTAFNVRTAQKPQ